MSDIEKLLTEEKERVNNLEAPPELEERLKMALESTNRRPRRRLSALWISIAAALIMFMFAGYNYHALAYYGKKLLGFDEVFNGTLKELNEAGKGQIIDQQFTLDDGTVLTINALMTDVNRMIIYYTLSNPNGEVEETYSTLFQPHKITGFLTHANYEGGQGIMNEDGTEFKGSMEFEPPSPFSKKLSLEYWEYQDNGQLKEHVISIPYDPNQAMKAEVKKVVNKTIQVDKGKIHFDDIVASPTVTVVSGKLNVENFDRIHLGLHGIELIANGKSIPIMGSGSSSSLIGGSNFEIDYDALPAKLDTLQLNVKEFVGYKEIDATIPLKEKAQEPIKLSEEALLWIKEIKESPDGFEIRIGTDESVLLDKVFIKNKSGQIELQTTIRQEYVKEPSGQIIKERTLLFKTTEQPEELIIGGIHYQKTYNQIIDIPLK
ncbi:DUF4179 domain-containing protein [Bacillus sp. AK128]